jgi:hypothetical protein
MTRESIVFLLGFLVFITSFLGIPREWKEWVFVVSGVFLMFLGYKLRRAAFLRSIMHESGEHRGEAFVEHMNPPNAPDYEATISVTPSSEVQTSERAERSRLKI